MIEGLKVKKLKAYRHRERPYATNAYMVGDDDGLVCGGNLMMYIPYKAMGRLDYPTVFKSRGEASRFAIAYY